MRALLILLLLVAVLTPGFILGLVASPWFFLILFLLFLLFPLVLWREPDTGGRSTSPGPLVWILVGAAIIFALPVLLLGIVLAPGFFLLILLLIAPLLWLAFGPSS